MSDISGKNIFIKVMDQNNKEIFNPGSNIIRDEGYKYLQVLGYKKVDSVKEAHLV